jgi:plastocyanin
MRPARFIRLFALTTVVAVVLAACSAGDAPGWTFAPTPSPSVAPSVAPSESAAASSSPGASGAPAPSGSTAPSGGTGGTVLTEVAFQTTALEAPANQPFTIAFDNQDAGIPHNIQIADSSGAFVFEGDTINGVAQITYTVPALAAGTYKFSCKWHPTMVGDLTVK